MFAAIGNDDFFTDVEDILEILDISENLAVDLKFLSRLENIEQIKILEKDRIIDVTDVERVTREIHILRSLMTGASNSQIAEEQFISEFTVKSHLYQIFKKLCVKNRVQATAWAKQHLLS